MKRAALSAFGYAAMTAMLALMLWCAVQVQP